MIAFINDKLSKFLHPKPYWLIQDPYAEDYIIQIWSTGITGTIDTATLIAFLNSIDKSKKWRLPDQDEWWQCHLIHHGCHYANRTLPGNENDRLIVLVRTTSNTEHARFKLFISTIHMFLLRLTGNDYDKRHRYWPKYAVR